MIARPRTMPATIPIARSALRTRSDAVQQAPVGAKRRFCGGDEAVFVDPVGDLSEQLPHLGGMLEIARLVDLEVRRRAVVGEPVPIDQPLALDPRDLGL